MEGSMEMLDGLLDSLLSHLGNIDAERKAYLQLLRKHGLQPSLMRTIDLLREVERETWIQRARDELGRGESATAVLRKFRYNFIKQES
jgi:hypothetical protein